MLRGNRKSQKAKVWIGSTKKVVNWYFTGYKERHLKIWSSYIRNERAKLNRYRLGKIKSILSFLNSILFPADRNQKSRQQRQKIKNHYFIKHFKESHSNTLKTLQFPH